MRKHYIQPGLVVVLVGDFLVGQSAEIRKIEVTQGSTMNGKDIRSWRHPCHLDDHQASRAPKAEEPNPANLIRLN